MPRMYGLTIHQSFRYFSMYPKDAPFLKATVRGFYIYVADAVVMAYRPTQVVLLLYDSFNSR